MTYFRIDFLRPGRAFPKDTPLSRLQLKATSTATKLGNKLLVDVGASFSALVIGASLLLISFVLFYTLIHLPREKTLQAKSQEIKKLEEQARVIREKQQQEEAKHKLIKDRIDQLMSIKLDSITWSDKLKAINRNLVNGVWLSSMEVSERLLKIDPQEEEKKKAAQNLMPTKKEEGAEPPKVIASQMLVTITGGTLDQKESKPLKLISKFMANMMRDPVWGKHFDFKDWTLRSVSREVKDAQDPEAGESQKVTEINFRLELERKQ